MFVRFSFLVKIEVRNDVRLWKSLVALEGFIFQDFDQFHKTYFFFQN